MIKKIIYLFALPSILILGACATNKTAMQADQNDDVYYSVAQAKEYEVVQVIPKEKRSADYVTDEELYGDGYSRNYGYETDYTSRFYRFRNYSPSLGYYNSLYGYNYDPYFNNSFYPYSYYGSQNIYIGIDRGYYNYNPWRYYGYNYGSNFWGPYSYYNTWNPYGYGGGYYGGNYNRGYYGGVYNNPNYTSPNYRPRPSRTGDNIYTDRGSVTGGSGAIIKDGNGNVIQSRGRAERYGDEVRANPNATTPRSSNTRPQTSPRPERVSQSPPQRVSQPERINNAPSQDSGSQRSSSPSNNNGGNSTGGARPTRGNN